MTEGYPDAEILLAVIEQGDRLQKAVTTAVSRYASLGAQSALELWLSSSPPPLPILLAAARESLELPALRASLAEMEIGRDGVNDSGCGGSAAYVETDEEVGLRGQERAAAHNYNLRESRIYTLGYEEGAAIEAAAIRTEVEQLTVERDMLKKWVRDFETFRMGRPETPFDDGVAPPSYEDAKLARIAQLENSLAGSRRESADARTEVEKLNQMLRDHGYAQGQVDCYVAQCEALETAEAEVGRLRDRVAEAGQLLTVADELADDRLSPPSMGGGEMSACEVEEFRRQVAAFRAGDATAGAATTGDRAPATPGAITRTTPEQWEAGVVDVEGKVCTKTGIAYLGKAYRQPDGTWRCLANVRGALCLVQINLYPMRETGTDEPAATGED